MVRSDSEASASRDDTSHRRENHEATPSFETHCFRDAPQDEANNKARHPLSRHSGRRVCAPIRNLDIILRTLFRDAGFDASHRPGMTAAACPPGKSPKSLSSPATKNIRPSPVGQISGLAPRVSPDERGGSRSSRTCGEMRWTRVAAKDERCCRGRRSRVVLMPRCWHQLAMMLRITRGR
jgi:hypothetical protein